MSKEHAIFIKTLREERGFSQQAVADKLNIARTSYLAIEQGKRELTLSEAQIFADMFGILMEDIETGVVPNYEKYKEMILAYIRKAGDDLDGKIPKTKLAKMLYLADFAWYYKHLQSMSGMKYRRIEFGPVPDMYFRAIDELEQDGSISIERKGDAMLIGQNEGAKRMSLRMLSKEEKKLIADIAKKWKSKRTNAIVKFTHEQLPYKLCAPDEIIPYELIIQEDPEYVF
jgi:transcriptional regulator with XRE-family HTH domain